MTPSQPDTGLAANLARLARLVQPWPGEVIDPAATMRALHPEAPQVPVYWCFNGVDEFTALAAAFGPSQPLVGMRSLNQVFTVTPDTTQALDQLAAHYADALLLRFARRPCIIGGNCQSAAIAWRVAVRLRAAGVPVLRLVTLDAEPRLPYPGALRLLYGERSQAYNPHLSPPEDPARPIPWHWARAWARPDCHIVPGGHGEYFRPENLPEVARAILAPGPHPPSANGPAMRWRIVGTTLGTVTVRGEVPPSLAETPGLALLPMWRNAGGGLLRVSGPDWVVPLATSPVWLCRLARPDPVPGAALALVLCAEGQGPLSWPWGESQLTRDSTASSVQP